MKQVTRIVSFTVILGLLAIVSASAQSGITPNTEASNLGLLITINRLELADNQKQQIRDILAGVLDEANTLKQSRSAFEQEMLRFNGTGEGLDALVEAFREQQTALATAVQEKVHSALEDLKGILTLKQGETLGGVFDRLLGTRFGVMVSQGDRFQGGPQGMQGRAMGEARPSEMRERAAERLRERFGEDAADFDRPAQFLSDHPRLQGRLAEQDRKDVSDADPFFRPGDRQSGRFAGFMLRRGAFGERLLSQLEAVIDILDAKLQSVN